MLGLGLLASMSLNPVLISAESNSDITALSKEQIREEAKTQLRAQINDNNLEELPSHVDVTVSADGEKHELEFPKGAIVEIPYANGENSEGQRYASIVEVDFNIGENELKFANGSREYAIDKDNGWTASIQNLSSKFNTTLSNILFGSTIYAEIKGKGKSDYRFSGDLKQEIYVEYDEWNGDVSLEYLETKWERGSTSYDVDYAELHGECSWRGGSYEDTFNIGEPDWQTTYSTYDYADIAECGYTDKESQKLPQVGHTEADFYDGNTRYYDDVRTKIELTEAGL
ncbi:hypothetical protein LCL89_09755 [Halobacillus yeomjeoni]|uniref:hypothetical protein n=1 Tax=Halobacillus yeomjeoni TaxID=311194 RepID=UPI001CD778F9|nr:hypothetical protein [Halobacillus yeomjeoni]MCA0984330.1 hypothetical protein [Halobacillus yeomjeoni]